jgi:hypothetical protein
LINQLTPTVTAMPRQCDRTCPSGEVDLEQHGNDHQPDEHRDRQIDFGDRRRAKGAEQTGQHLSERNASHDAERDPKRQVAFERPYRGRFRRHHIGSRCSFNHGGRSSWSSGGA